MSALRVHVERAVRPIRASGRRKDRMREELLAHLRSVFEAELARGDDAQAAAEEAIRRFGAAEDVSRELQAGVPRIERWLHAPMPGLGLADRVSRPRDGELPSQTMRRVAITQTALSAAGAACLVGAATFLRAGGIEGLGRRIVLGCGVVSPLLGGFVLLFVLMAPIMMRAMGLEGVERRSRGRLIGGLVASGMVVAGAVLGFVRLVNWYAGAAIFGPDQWWALLVTALMAPFALVVWGRDLDRFRRWGSLELDEAE